MPTKPDIGLQGGHSQNNEITTKNYNEHNKYKKKNHKVKEFNKFEFETPMATPSPYPKLPMVSKQEY